MNKELDRIKNQLQLMKLNDVDFRLKLVNLIVNIIDCIPTTTPNKDPSEIKPAQKVWHGLPNRECYVLEHNLETDNVLIIPVAVKHNKRVAYWVPIDELSPTRKDT